MEATVQSWVCNKLGEALGAEIVGLDLSKDMSDEEFDSLIDCFHENAVLVIRNQTLQPEQHIAFSKRIGPLQVHIQSTYHLPGYPEIYSISNCLDENGKPIGLADAGKVWHTDLSYMKEPSRCSLLHALEVPHDDDGTPLGNTLFINTQVAYERLPDEMKQRIKGLKAVHNYQYIYDQIQSIKREGVANLVPLTDEQKKKVPPTEHPIVIAHPFTGKPILFVNEGITERIVGMDEAESKALLAELYAHLQKPEFKYTHKWRVGDLLMWDNFSTQHLAMHDYELPRRRRMRRTTVQGSQPTFA